jgi:uncharacterized protein (TIGR01244 family)
MLRLALVFFIFLSGCASSPQNSTSNSKQYEQRSVLVDRYLIGPQPSDTDIRTLNQKGYKRIVNFRTIEEMNDRKEVGFDEADLAKELGMEYLIIPVGGAKNPFSPKTLSALEQVLKKDDSPILLHCSSGSRVGMVWAAYAVRHLGKTPDEALKELEPLGLWPLSLEKLLGVPLTIQIKHT